MSSVASESGGVAFALAWLGLPALFLYGLYAVITSERAVDREEIVVLVVLGVLSGFGVLKGRVTYQRWKRGVRDE